MKLSEAQALLEMISAIDGRPVTDDISFAWATILDAVPAQDAMQAAVDHFRNHPEKWIMPGHILAGAVRVAEERKAAARAALEPLTPFGFPPGDPRNDDALRAYEASRENRHAPAVPSVRVVPSPALAWERSRVETVSPLITDADRIEEQERNRRRFLRVLGDMIEHPHPDTDTVGVIDG